MIFLWMLSLCVGGPPEANLKSARAISEKYWAQSWNFDDNAKVEILPTEVLRDLGVTFHERDGKKVVSAGIMHTYGYCVSTIDTPYGKKSKRWFEDRMDETLGLGQGVFLPKPTSGEFLANVTYTLLALTQGRLEKIQGTSPAVVRALQTSRAKRWARRVESAQGYRLITDLLRGVGDKLLLVYSVQTPGSKAPRLVTVFPVEESFAEGLRKKRPLMKPQFNLSLDGFEPSASFETTYEGYFSKTSI